MARMATTIKNVFVVMVAGCIMVAASPLFAAKAKPIDSDKKRSTEGEGKDVRMVVRLPQPLLAESKLSRGIVLGGSPAGKVAGLLGNILKAEHPTQEQIAQLKRRIRPGDAVQFFMWIYKKEVFARARQYLHDYDYSTFLVEDPSFAPLNDEKVEELVVDDELDDLLADVIGDEKAGDLAYDKLADAVSYAREKRTQRIVAVSDLCAGLRNLVPAGRVRLWKAFVQYILGVETGNQLNVLSTNLFMTKFFEPLIALEGNVTAEVVIRLFDIYDKAYLVGGTALIRKRLS